MNKLAGWFIIFLSLSVLVYACTNYYFRENYRDVNSMLTSMKESENKVYLKAHLRNGDVVIFKKAWTLDSLSKSISGNAIRYDYNRELREDGEIVISTDSVIIYETNKSMAWSEDGRKSTIMFLTGLNATVTGFCIISPKTCFGSCPTFYIDENDNFHYADAEGFSSAILPSLEYEDVDALNSSKLNDYIDENFIDITLKNEALETHCIRSVSLLGYPVKNNQKVFHSNNDKFYLTENTYLPDKATSNNNDITKLLKYDDRKEWLSLSDEKNLISKEEIILKFDSIDNSDNLGLNIHFRQSLMTTFLFYNTMSYMGDEFSDYFALLEREPVIMEKLNNGLKKELGNIDIYVWNASKQNWIYQAGLNEQGPISINRQFVKLKDYSGNNNVRIKLVLNKALWRIDYTSLCNVISEVKPYEMTPKEIRKDGKTDYQSLSKLLTKDDYLITSPGESYKLRFEIPTGEQRYEYFLKSKGYYLEWMRESWLEGKNIAKLYMLLEQPKLYLKSVAKDFKSYESQMEADFWNSKIQNERVIYDK